MATNGGAADIKLTVGIDTAASWSLIDGDMEKVINHINKKKYKVTIGLNTSVKTAWASQIKSLLSDLSKKDFSVKVSHVKIGASAISDFKKQLGNVVDKLSIEKGYSISLDSKETGKIASGVRSITTATEEAIRKTTEFEAKLKLLKATSSSLTSGVNKTKSSLGVSEVDLRNVEQLNQKYVEMQAAVELVKKKGAKASDEEIENAERLQEELRQLILSIKERQQAVAAEAAAEKRAANSTEEYYKQLNKVNDALARGEANLNKWTAAKNGKSKDDYRAYEEDVKNLRALKTQLESAGTSLADFNNSFGEIDSNMRAHSGAIKIAGENYVALGDKVKSLGTKFIEWYGITQIIMQVISAIKKMVTAVKEVDAAMTELKKVTDETNTTYNNFLNTASTRAKDLGAKVSDVVNATADFARLGFGIEDASMLADAAIVYKNVGDGIENISEASESVISTMQAFGIAASDAMSIVDRFNEVGNNFAISSKGVGDALLRSAAAMSAAGNTLDETIALATAANTVIQNPESVGTALKTISMYLRAAKVELKEAGEDTDGMAESVSKLREKILGLTGIDIQINEHTFKSTTQILRELASVWQDLEDDEQAALTELMGGKRNGNIISALMNNFDIVEKVIATSQKSTGSALRENEKYLDSIEGKISRLNTAFETLSYDFIGSELIKSLVDIATHIVNAIDGIVRLTNVIGGLKTTIPIITSIVVLFKGLVASFAMMQGPAIGMKAALAGLGAALTPLQSILLVIGAITAAASISAKVIDAVTVSYEEQAEKVKELRVEYEKLYGAGSEYDNLLARATQLTEQEQARLEILQKQKEVLDKQIERESKKEFRKWGQEQQKNYFTPTGTLSLTGLDRYKSEYYSATSMYDSGRMSLDDYRDTLGDLVSAGAEFNEQYNYYKELGYDVSAFDSIANWYDELTTAFTAAMDVNTPKYFKEQFAKEWKEASTETDYWISTIKNNLNKFADDQGVISADVIKKIGEDVAKHGDSYEYWNDQEAAYIRLQAAAKQYGLSVEELVAALIDLGAVEAGSAIKNKTEDIANLKDELEEATDAIKNFNKALEDGEKGDVAESYASAYAQFIEDWKAGRTGTNAVAAAVELFIPEEVLRDLDYDMTAAGELLASDIYKAIFGVESKNYAKNFIDYIKSNISSLGDVVSYSEDGLGNFSFGYSSLPELAEALGITEEMTTALLDALDAYGPAVMMSASDTAKLAESLNLVKSNAASSEGEIKAVINALAEQGNGAFGIKSLLDSLASAGYIDLSNVTGQLGTMISAAVEAQNAAQEANAEEIEDKTVKIDADASEFDSEVARIESWKPTVTVTVKADTSKAESTIAGLAGLGSSGGGGSGSLLGSLFSKIKANAGGTTSASQGKTLVNELGPELISENGEAYIANGGNPAIVDLSEGAIVLDATATKKALASSSSPKGSTIKSAASGLSKGKEFLENRTQTAPIAASGNWGYTDGGGGGGGDYDGGSSGNSSENGDSWFERQYKEHKHLINMDKEEVRAFLQWLHTAYQQAYSEGIIDLDEFYKYQEEVYNGIHDLFRDGISDKEFEISMLEKEGVKASKLSGIYEQLIISVQNEIRDAYAQGLDDNDDYVQELKKKLWEYHDAIEDMRKDAEKGAKNSIDDLIDYRIDMIKKGIDDEKESYNERLSNLKDFIDQQKNLIDSRESEDDYIKQQAEKRKKIADIEGQLAELEYDDSAWAEKRKLQLAEELVSARENLADFEKDYAIKKTKEELDEIYRITDEATKKHIELIDAEVGDAKTLYEQALEDIRNNNQQLFDEMIAYEEQFGSGTAEAVREMWEEAYVALSKYTDLYGGLYKGVSLNNFTGYVAPTSPSNFYTGSVFNEQGAVPTSSSYLNGNPTTTAPSLPPSGYPSESTGPSLVNGSYVDVKSGAKWYSDSYGNGAWGYAHSGIIMYTNPGSEYPYNIDGAGWIRKEDIVGYASGTGNATRGIHKLFENGDEYVFTSGDGNTYRMFSDGEKVLSAGATKFLYDFANSRGAMTGLEGGRIPNIGGIATSPNITMGDIIIQGNADSQTVSEIRRAQRENVKFMLEEFNKLKR